MTLWALIAHYWFFKFVWYITHRFNLYSNWFNWSLPYQNENILNEFSPSDSVLVLGMFLNTSFNYDALPETIQEIEYSYQLDNSNTYEYSFPCNDLDPFIYDTVL